MSEMMQPLESRLLFSTTTVILSTDIAMLNSAKASANSQLTAVHTAEAALHSRITADVKASQTKSQVASNRRLYSVVTSAELSGYARILAAEFTGSRKTIASSARATTANSIRTAKRPAARPKPRTKNCRATRCWCKTACCFSKCR